MSISRQIFLVAFMLVMSGTQISPNENEISFVLDLYRECKKIHTPIHISGNDDFAQQAQQNGWNGNGTIYNPYVIEGYSIDGKGGKYCISITNTNVYFIIRNCSLYNATEHDGAAIILRNVIYGRIESNTCALSYHGVMLFGSSKNVIVNNIIIGNSGNGIWLLGGESNTILNNRIEKSSATAIDIYSSNNNTISENVLLACDKGIRSYDSTGDKIVFNNIREIRSVGVEFYMSDYSYAFNNELYVQVGCEGIYARLSHGIFIFNNTISLSYNGVILELSKECEISNNTIIKNSYYGIYLRTSYLCKISNNYISDSQYGVALENSQHAIITNNTLWKCGITINADTLACWNTHDISNNIANGKKIYYYKNQTGILAPSDASQLILANCTGCLIKNLTISEVTIGIILGFSTKNTIEKNIVIKNLYQGIALYYSYNNAISGNIISENYHALYLKISDSNIITHNRISDNYYGIVLLDSKNNTIIYNNILRSASYGASIFGLSSNNSIHHNNFIENNVCKGIAGKSQAWDDNGKNNWFDSTVLEGNYWSNWDGLDWGTPQAYPIDGDAGASDWYPLRSPLSEKPYIAMIVVFVLLITKLIRVRYEFSL